ncbi:MAG: hypothetical protein HOV68_17605 [Streptomycetaceae bacterium]|nr:hypothetical protein [Streptomycetaceae bacterium]
MTDETPEPPVAAMLAHAGITPPDDEVAALAAAFAANHANVRCLYEVAEARYEDPALVFRPRP